MLPTSQRLVFKHPGYLRGPAQAEYLQIPCGQCVGCRLERSRQWAVRCYHEAQLHTENSFVTLTYKQMPKDQSIDKRELVLFLKRLRNNFGAKIRFYGCGEYGDDVGRPHYHAVLFNFNAPDLREHEKNKNGDMVYTSKILDKIWGHGYTYTGNVTFQSAAYVARYILKKVHGPTSRLHYENVDKQTGELLFDKIPEFTNMSRRPGIGAKWYQKYGISDCHQQDEVIINGKTMRPPRYYDQLLENGCPSIGLAADPERMVAIKLKRVQDARQHADNNTDARLAVREIVQNAKLERLPRNTQ